MERRIHLYVSRKNVFVWLSMLALLASAVLRIVAECLYNGHTIEPWSELVLPVAAVVLFIGIVLIVGDEMLYKTAVPIWIMCLYYAIRPHTLVTATLMEVLYWTCLLFFAVMYTLLISGKLRAPWVITVMHAAALGLLAYLHTYLQENGLDAAIDPIWEVLPDYLFFGGCLLLTFVTRVHSDDKYHPTWGDRIDGRKIRTLAPMAQITAYFQVERNACSNFFEESFEITNIDRYIRQKRREGYTDFGITHVLLAAYVRGIAKYPQLNRFINGQKVYSRGTDIQYNMVIKKTMSVDSPDTSFKVHLHPGDTAVDVYNKMNEAVKKIKATQELDSNLDSLIMTLNLIPSVVLKFVVWLLKLLDYFGLLPRFLLELSPFHGSLFYTSMGSLGIPPIYHHLYDFGNLPCFGAFGCKRRAFEVQEDGSVVQRKYVDMKFVLDERIVDGFYYATFFKYFRRLLAHPEVLDNPPETIEKDID